MSGYKSLANMYFNQHSGRRGVRSATNVAEKMLRKKSSDMGTIRGGPAGMGMVNPVKPTQLPSGSSNTTKPFSHLHQIHELYNEK